MTNVKRHKCKAEIVTKGGTNAKEERKMQWGHKCKVDIHVFGANAQKGETDGKMRQMQR
jgi:hypothetical protein